MLILVRRYTSFLVQVSKPNSMLWPFKCEDMAWNKWKCAADTMVSLPARALPLYRSECLGRLSCHPDANMSGNFGPIPSFDHNEGGVHIGAGFSGHGCFRCASQALQGLQLRFGFADDTLHMRSNPRETAGLNRWYTFASEHLLRCVCLLVKRAVYIFFVLRVVDCIHKLFSVHPVIRCTEIVDLGPLLNIREE
jgi:hypothetical protein